MKIHSIQQFENCGRESWYGVLVEMRSKKNTHRNTTEMKLRMKWNARKGDINQLVAWWCAMYILRYPHVQWLDFHVEIRR